MRIPTVALALACGLAVPSAPAQEVRFSGEPIEVCLSTTQRYAQALDCIGFAAEACTARMGSTDDAAAACLHAEQAFWDGRLRRAHDMLSALDRQDDALSAGLGPGAATRAPWLEKMMQSWAAYRDDACGHARALWGGGRGGGRAESACLLRETARQALELERLVAER